MPISTEACELDVEVYTFAGTVITGGKVSIKLIVTNCVADDVFPFASVAVHVTTVVPAVNLAGASFITS